MGTIVFIIIMTTLIKSNNETWWLWYVLIMGGAILSGMKVGIVEIAVSMGISKVLKDIFRCQ